MLISLKRSAWGTFIPDTVLLLMTFVHTLQTYEVIIRQESNDAFLLYGCSVKTCCVGKIRGSVVLRTEVVVKKPDEKVFDDKQGYGGGAAKAVLLLSCSAVPVVYTLRYPHHCCDSMQ